MSRLRKVLGAASKNLPEAATETIAAPKKAKKYVTQGPHLYVSMMLNRKAPLTAQQIWNEFQKDNEAKEADILKSKTYLKRKILDEMERQHKVYRAGFSQLNRKFLGFRLNPDVAFRNVHPDIISALDPKPVFKDTKLAQVVNPTVTVE